MQPGTSKALQQKRARTALREFFAENLPQLSQAGHQQPLFDEVPYDSSGDAVAKEIQSARRAYQPHQDPLPKILLYDAEVTCFENFLTDEIQDKLNALKQAKTENDFVPLAKKLAKAIYDLLIEDGRLHSDIVPQAEMGDPQTLPYQIFSSYITRLGKQFAVAEQKTDLEQNKTGWARFKDQIPTAFKGLSQRKKKSHPTDTAQSDSQAQLPATSRVTDGAAAKTPVKAASEQVESKESVPGAQISAAAMTAAVSVSVPSSPIPVTRAVDSLSPAFQSTEAKSPQQAPKQLTSEEHARIALGEFFAKNLLEPKLMQDGQKEQLFDKVLYDATESEEKIGDAILFENFLTDKIKAAIQALQEATTKREFDLRADELYRAIYTLLMEDGTLHSGIVKVVIEQCEPKVGEKPEEFAKRLGGYVTNYQKILLNSQIFLSFILRVVTQNYINSPNSSLQRKQNKWLESFSRNARAAFEQISQEPFLFLVDLDDRNIDATAKALNDEGFSLWRKAAGDLADGKLYSQNVAKINGYQRHLNELVTLHVLSQKTIFNRSQVMQDWIEVMYRCYQAGNYLAVQAIKDAIEGVVLREFHTAKGFISDEAWQHFKFFQGQTQIPAFTQHDLNEEELRQEGEDLDRVKVSLENARNALGNFVLANVAKLSRQDSLLQAFNASAYSNSKQNGNQTPELSTFSFENFLTAGIKHTAGSLGKAISKQKFVQQAEKLMLAVYELLMEDRTLLCKIKEAVEQEQVRLGNVTPREEFFTNCYQIIFFSIIKRLELQILKSGTLQGQQISWLKTFFAANTGIIFKQMLSKSGMKVFTERRPTAGFHVSCFLKEVNGKGRNIIPCSIITIVGYLEDLQDDKEPKAPGSKESHNGQKARDKHIGVRADGAKDLILALRANSTQIISEEKSETVRKPVPQGQVENIGIAQETKRGDEKSQSVTLYESAEHSRGISVIALLENIGRSERSVAKQISIVQRRYIESSLSVKFP